VLKTPSQEIGKNEIALENPTNDFLGFPRHFSIPRIFAVLRKPDFFNAQAIYRQLRARFRVGDDPLGMWCDDFPEGVSLIGESK
jgi:hypothetical protein